MPDVVFRTADASDVAQLQPFVHAGYRGDSARLGWTHEADLLDGERIDQDSLRALLADPAQRVILAERDRSLVGCVQIADKGSGLAYLGMLTVAPALQGRGLGRRLIDKAEQMARQAFRAARMEMTVIAQRSELIAWYERRGYARTGETRPFPITDPRFGSPRRSDLAFTVLEKPLV